ncbi:hypothetical protein [Streptomyces sp. NPDC088183]|uniref:hypothetical protein n=1 Tax=Streptomyces sp. NPDC088183 TaxID=3160992 RepID=UPI003415CE6E
MGGVVAWLYSLPDDKRQEIYDIQLRGLKFTWVAVAVTVAALIFGLAREAINERSQRKSFDREMIRAMYERLTSAEAAFGQSLRPDNISATQTRTAPIVSQRDSEGDGNAQPEQEADLPAPLGLAVLWETTHARLSLYHKIATGQAESSFASAKWSMWAGFALLIAFVVLALTASTTAGAVVAGGLGAVAAALSGFVSKTFIRSQEAAASHLRTYFDQPLELSRYLAAERLIVDGDLSQQQRADVLSALVQAMVASPAQPPAASSPAPGQPVA